MVGQVKLIAISSHRSSYPDPISFEAGEGLGVGDMDSEYPGWIRVTTGDGNQGWAPEQYLTICEDASRARAKQDYCARELDTEVGDMLALMLELNQWVLVSNSAGETGWVPLATIAGV